jgi:hypothetical protein
LVNELGDVADLEWLMLDSTSSDAAFAMNWQ